MTIDQYHQFLLDANLCSPELSLAEVGPDCSCLDARISRICEECPTSSFLFFRSNEWCSRRPKIFPCNSRATVNSAQQCGCAPCCRRAHLRQCWKVVFIQVEQQALWSSASSFNPSCP
jgi:hypothetical protein